MKYLFSLFLTLLLFSYEVNAQTGEIYGTVTSKKFTPFEGVKVTVYQGARIKLSTVTEEDGSYSLMPLKSGCYDIVFEARDYMTTKIFDVELEPEDEVKVKCNMKKGAEHSIVSIVFTKPKMHLHSSSDSSFTVFWFSDFIPERGRSIDDYLPEAPVTFDSDWSMYMRALYRHTKNAYKQFEYTDNDILGEQITVTPKLQVDKSIYKYYSNNRIYSEQQFRNLPIPVFLKDIGAE